MTKTAMLVTTVALAVQTPSLAVIAAGTSPAGRAFHELNLNGLPNLVGLSIFRVERAGTLYRLEINGTSIVARPSDLHLPALSGRNLVGLNLELRDSTGAHSVIRISDSGSTTYWAAPLEPVPTYTLTYTSATHSDPQPLCNASGNEAILFAGDRYDAERKTVTATGDATAGWFNIACAGTALAKLHLTRHTEASQIVRTTAVERQAMLKMFTADVCGDGTSFTVHGQPLLWADANHLTAFNRPAASLEAVWTDRGAACLDTPRRPELADAIAAHCGALPRCTSQRGYVISGNPL
jgi:ADYC domain